MNETLFLPAGDSAVNVEFGRTIDPEINKKIRGLSDSLSRKPIRGVTESIINGYFLSHYETEHISDCLIFNR